MSILTMKKDGYLAARHLIENGHRRIACITGPNGAASISGRIQGYRMALAESGIPYDPSIMAEGDFYDGVRDESGGAVKGQGLYRNLRFQ